MSDQKNICLSVLDQSPIRKGATAADALQESILLAQAAEKLDEYVAGLLPVKHKRVYGAGGALRAVGRCEKIKPSDIMSRRKMLDCLSRLDEIGARFNGKR